MLYLTTVLCCRMSSGLAKMIYISISVFCNHIPLPPFLLMFQLSEVLKKGYLSGSCRYPYDLDVLPNNGYGGQ